MGRWVATGMRAVLTLQRVDVADEGQRPPGQSAAGGGRGQGVVARDQVEG